MAKRNPEIPLTTIKNCSVVDLIRHLRFDKGQPTPTKPARSQEEVKHIVRHTPSHKPGTNSGTDK